MGALGLVDEYQRILQQFEANFNFKKIKIEVKVTLNFLACFVSQSCFLSVKIVLDCCFCQYKGTAALGIKVILTEAVLKVSGSQTI